MSGDVTRVRVRVGTGDDTFERVFIGRAAWALEALATAGDGGLTTLTRPAPRWSHYVYLLRRGGVGIETQHETHHGAYAGHHGRYRLTVPVTVLEIEREAEAA